MRAKGQAGDSSLVRRCRSFPLGGLDSFGDGTRGTSDPLLKVENLCVKWRPG